MNCLNCKEIISKKKKFCNNQCQKEYEYKNYIEKWKKCEVNGIRGANLNNGRKSRKKYTK